MEFSRAFRFGLHWRLGLRIRRSIREIIIQRLWQRLICVKIHTVCTQKPEDRSATAEPVWYLPCWFGCNSIIGDEPMHRSTCNLDCRAGFQNGLKMAALINAHVCRGCNDHVRNSFPTEGSIYKNRNVTTSFHVDHAGTLLETSIIFIVAIQVKAQAAGSLGQGRDHTIRLHPASDKVCQGKLHFW